MKDLIDSQAEKENVDISFVDEDRFLIYCMGGAQYIHFSSREERIFTTLQKELQIEGECIS